MKVLQIGPSCKSKLDDNLKDQRWREWFSGCIAVMLSCQYVFLDWLGVVTSYRIMILLVEVQSQIFLYKATCRKK